MIWTGGNLCDTAAESEGEESGFSPDTRATLNDAGLERIRLFSFLD